MLFRSVLYLLVAAAVAPAFGQGIAWQMTSDLKNDEAALEISGASCPILVDPQSWCLVVNDKKKYVQLFGINGRSIVPGDRIRILKKRDAAGRKQSQPDIEGIARDGGFVYLTGSHGAPRDEGKPVQSSRFLVYRLPVDPATGEPAFDISRKELARGIGATDSLRAAIRSHPQLASFAERKLQDQGVTIEGLGARSGQLFFGFRTPVDESGAYILEASADALFSSVSVKPKTHRIPLEDGYGIRAIERFRDAFLLLAGTGYGQEMPPVLWLWSPGYPPHKVLDLDVPKGWKAEGVMLLSDDAQRGVRALVFFDGQKNGAPMEFELPIR